MNNTTIHHILTADPIRYYFGVFLCAFSSIGVLLNVSAVFLLLLHTRILARNQRLTVLNVACCDLIYALIGVLVRGPSYISPRYEGAFSRSPSLCLSTAVLINLAGSVNNVALLPITFDRWFVLSYPMKYRLTMTSRRVKIIMLSSWVPNIVFLLVEVATVLLSDGVVVGSTHVRARCAIDGLMALEVARMVVCSLVVTALICTLYCAMWRNICTSSLNTYHKKKLTSKHKKFGIISGSVILTCALSWIPSSFIYFTNIYIDRRTLYYVFLGLHYMITVTNPIVYILGTQGNVGQALVSTPIQYRRKISRPSMYNSETVHRNSVVRKRASIRTGSYGGNSLELISEVEYNYKSTDCLAN